MERGLIVFCRGLLHSGLTGGSLIAEVLLLNADVLGVAASPLMDFEEATLYVLTDLCLLPINIFAIYAHNGRIVIPCCRSYLLKFPPHKAFLRATVVR